jgi:uncharacterized protein (TIGR00255 family)
MSEARPLSQSAKKAEAVSSMTGFASTESNPQEPLRFRMEIKSLNHRFLDLKCRLPRELSSAEIPLRNFLQKEFSRGSIDLKVERIENARAQEESHLSAAQLARARTWYEQVEQVRRNLGLVEAVGTRELLEFSGLFEQVERPSLSPEEAWKLLEPLVQQASLQLKKMREVEGAALKKTLIEAAQALHATVDMIRSRREECADLLKRRMNERIRAVFEAYPLPPGLPVAAVLESRIAQELGILLDRTDIEEELTRLVGHLDHLIVTIEEGGAIGRKLEFLLQELGREINTLGNKAQDLPVAEQVLLIKVKLEQIREQVLNLV